MSMTEYNMRFTELSCHVAFLIPTKVDKVKRFIEELHFGFKIAISREAKTETIFLLSMDIVRMIECIQDMSRETMVIRGKRPRHPVVSVVPHLEVGIILGEAILAS